MQEVFSDLVRNDHYWDELVHINHEDILRELNIPADTL